MDAQIEALIERFPQHRRASGPVAPRRLGAARGARPRRAADPRLRPADGRARRGRDPRGVAGRWSRTMPALALDVIKGDAIINEAQRGVSRLIAVTIATQQPVARDLRYLLTLDHVTYELERMGDHAASVAKAVDQARTRAAARAPRPPARDGRARRRPRPRRPAGAGRIGRDQGPRDRGRGRRDRPALPRDVRRGRRADARRTRPTSSAARGSSSPRTTSSGSATGRRTSPRTSSTS